MEQEEKIDRVAQLEDQVARLTRDNTRLSNELQALLNRLFRQKNERLDSRQLSLFLEEAAAAGSVDARVRLGEMYYWGQGVAEDRGAAEDYMLEAASRGSSEAAYNLGTFYSNDKVIPQSYDQAKFWFEEAKAAGHPHADRVWTDFQRRYFSDR